MRPVIIGILLSIVFTGASFAQDAGLGEKVFIKCKVCHQVGDGAKTLVGPELNGVVGRNSASIDGFNYSDGMKKASLTWTADNLSEYLKNPKQKVPGNRMAFVGLSKPEDIANVISYLKQFDASGKKTPYAEPALFVSTLSRFASNQYRSGASIARATALQERFGTWRRHSVATFSAIVLICLASVPQEDCNEKTAVDVLSIRVASEMGCAVGWQELLARSSLRESLGETAYLKTICRIDRRGTTPLPPG